MPDSEPRRFTEQYPATKPVLQAILADAGQLN